MPFNILSYKRAIWKGIEGHLKGIVQKLEDSLQVITYINLCLIIIPSFVDLMQNKAHIYTKDMKNATTVRLQNSWV